MGSSVGPYSTTLILTVPYYDVAMYSNPDPWEDPKSRSLNGGSYKVPLVVWGPKLGDLLSRSSRGSGKAHSKVAKRRNKLVFWARKTSLYGGCSGCLNHSGFGRAVLFLSSGM